MSPGPSLSLVVVSTGAPTLLRLLWSIQRNRLLARDEVLVIGNGEQRQAWDLTEQFGWRYRYRTGPTCDGPYPEAAWSYAIGIARGERLLVVDERDVLRPDAFERIRARCQGPAPVRFRMDGTSGWYGLDQWGVVWPTAMLDDLEWPADGVELVEDVIAERRP